VIAAPGVAGRRAGFDRGSSPRRRPWAVLVTVWSLGAGWGCAEAAATGDLTATDTLGVLAADGRAAGGGGQAACAERRLDAPAIGVAALGEAPGEAARLALLTGDVEALAAVVDRALAGVAPVVLVADVPLPADAEVAGPASCAGLDATRLALAASPRSVRLLPPSADVQADLTRGAKAAAAGKGPEARVAFASAARREGGRVAGPGLAIARSYRQEGRSAEALLAFGDLLPRFERIASVHAGLGDALRSAGRRGEAADVWARAVAVAPGATSFVRQLATDAFVEVRGPVPPPAARAPDGRWIMRPLRVPAGRVDNRISPEAASAGRDEALAYAACKEGFRGSAALQEAIVGEVLTPWRWSPAEEAACTAVWLRAYQRHRDAGRPEDEGLDDLLAVARAGFLLERGLFDVGALTHPLAPLLLSDQRLARLFAFVAAHRVLHRRQGGWLF
jgi:tetratricopeptide (TPR) repeat protein